MSFLPHYRKKIIFIASLCAALATFLVYLPAVSNGFVNWDDQTYVYQSQLIRSIDPAFFKTIFTSAVYSNWHPLTTFSYALDFMAWGLDPRGFHLTNIVFHSLNTFLVSIVSFLLAQAAMKKEHSGAVSVLPIAVGFGTALLFGLHPIHVESVAWISERKDVLFLFFYLLSILFYLWYQGKGKTPNYIISLAMFALALMSKPMAVSLPVVLLIIDLYPLERLKAGAVKKALIEKIPFFVLGVLAAFATIYAQKNAIIPLDKALFSTRAIVSAHSYMFYIYETLVPLWLAPYYPYPHEAHLFDFKYIGAFAALGAITLFCVFTFKKRKIFTAVWLFYLVTLLPVIGIVQVGGQAAADRYPYLPGLGIFILAAAGLGYCMEKILYDKRLILTIGALSIVSILLAIFTIKQISFWKDGVTLWTRQVEVYPEVAFGHINLGYALKDKGRLVEALGEFTRCIELSPEYATAYSNRAGIHYLLGEYESAIADINMAIALDPGRASYYTNREMLQRAIDQKKSH